MNRSLLASALAVLALLPAGKALANDAEIVLLVGRGDARESAVADWKPAAVKQQLVAGSFVRTLESSQMGLLLKDRTQVRLNQLTILNIKGTGPPTRLELPRGRVWSQAKPKSPQVADAKTPPLEISTPSAIASIRGTEWELTVDPDGTSTLTVLSGEVEFYNEAGRVLVLPKEQARAELGKMPVKILLSSAADRVQWVTSYRPQPRRWVRDFSGGFEALVQKIEASDYAAALEMLRMDGAARRGDVRASLLQADLNLFLGQADDAIVALAPHADGGRGDPIASALLARAYMIAGRLPQAAQLLEIAGQKYDRHVELLLARAELARLEGSEAGARLALRRVLDIEPENAEAWYAIGRMETEREYVAAAREALSRAIALRPDGPGYKAELATLETFANRLADAERIFREALEQQPSDYAALTGLGVLQLKRGEPEAALESFLKAGVIEPRYARAWFFSGAAYYQLGERARALEAFDKAAALDEKDPLPHLMASLVHYDALEFTRAIDAARRAKERMPNLKSFNQLLGDQKGTANVGSALAAFGLEEWSQAYAYESYSPYWAGSALFLADRFAGSYNRNSELFKGFLSEPGVFGASNRFSSLVPVPGHYASLGATASRDYLSETGVSASLNGYSVAQVPLSYSVNLDASRGNSRINSFDADGTMRANGENIVLGVGLRPSHELGVFAFANVSRYDGRIADRASGLIDNPFSLDYGRFDAGFSYRFNPASQAWLKIGAGYQKNPLSGAFFSQGVADTLNSAFATTIFGPAGRLNEFRSDVSQNDIQWRHTSDVAAGLQLTWGIEFAKEKKPFSLAFEFLPLRIRLNQDNRVESASAYLSGRFKVAAGLEAQVDLHYQDTKVSFSTDQSVDVVGGATAQLPAQSGATRHRELNPRVGLKWHPSPEHTLRMAVQAWRRPAGVNTLAPVDTVGIALDDQVENAGGMFRRARLQHESEWRASSFFEWFADLKNVRNPDAAGAGIVPGLDLDQLERLRARKRVFAVPQNYLERQPVFGAGEIRQAGVALNQLLSGDAALVLRYTWADTRNTTQAFHDLEVPYHPRHYLSAAANWQPAPRWVVGPVATYRSRRFTDEANTSRLEGGWLLGGHVYWESEDKRWSAGAVVDQIRTAKNSSTYRYPTIQAQGVYRF